MYSLLYVDDEPGLLEIGKLFLEQSGQFVVDITSSAKEALTLLNSKTYDGVISDYQMPGMDGIEFLKNVRASGNTIPFILFTGRGREEVVIQALNEGADFYLQKGGDPRSQFAELTHKILIAVDHHHAAGKIQSLNRLYSVLTATNKAIVYLQTKSEFFTEICRILVETGGFRMAWIGLADPEHKIIRPVASAGHVDGYLDNINISTEDVPHGRGPTGTAYREGKYYFSNDITRDPRMEPWRENALKHGYLANAAFPFALGTNNAGVISLYAPVVGFYDDQILGLLGELAADVSFALKTIDEKNDRKSAEESIRDHERREADIINFLPDATCVIDRSGHIIAWNCAIEEMTGVPAAEMLGKGDYEYAIPFYGKRQPTLINLVFEPDEVIARKYSHIIHKKDTLIADTTVPLLKGKPVTLMGMASPLYNRQGEVIGAIESIRDITERQLAENAVRASEEKYRTLVENVVDIIYRADCDGNLVFVTPSILPLIDYDTLDEIIGHPITSFWAHPEKRDDLITRMKEKGYVKDYEVIILKRDGTEIPVSISSHFYYDDTGRIAGVEGIIHDIIERKKAEESLKSSEERYRTLLQRSFDAIVVHRNGIITLANQGAATLVGASSSSELIGKKVLDFVHPAYRNTVGKRIAAMISGNEMTAVDAIEEKFLRIDGSAIDVEVVATSFLDEGQPAIQVVFRDITDRKNLEMALRESEERYKNVVEDQSEFITRFLPDGTHIFVNEAYCRYFGFTRDAILGHRFRPKIPAEDRERVERFFASLTPDHPVDIIDHRIIMPDGGIQWQRWSDRAIFDPSGTIIEYQSVGRDITEQKQEENALYDSEQRLASIYNTVGDVIFQLAVEPDEQYRFISVNSAFSKITGLPPDQVIGRKVNEIIPEPSLSMVLEKYRQAIEEKAMVHWEEISNYPRGQLTGDVSVSPVFDTAGNCTYLIGSVHDITERKRAEDALRKSERKYREIIENIQDMVYRTDRDGNLIMISPHGVKSAGYDSEEEMIGLNIANDTYQDPEERKRFLAALKEKGSVEDYPIVLKAKNGTSRFVTASSHFYYDEQGNVLGVEGILHDITDLSKKEQELRASEAQLKRAEEVGRSGSWEFRLSENVVSVSDGARVLYGLGETEWTIDEIQEIPLPEYRPLLDTAMRELISGKSPYNVEFKIQRRSDGAVLDIHSVAEYDPGRNVVFGVIHDITRQKQAEKELHLSNNKLKLLFSITRHDINNQLSLLMGYLALLQKEQLDTPSNRYFRKIMTAAERITEMVQFTKTYEEIGVNAPVWHDCRTLVDMAKKQNPLGKVVVQNNIPAGMEVLADPLIIKVFYNLIDNAIRHGGKITTIRFSIQESGDEHPIICEDDGDGVPADEKERIFERRYGKNTGLGLFLAREILRITGMTIRETGEPGKGARFEMTVPNGAYRFQ